MTNRWLWVTVKVKPEMQDEWEARMRAFVDQVLAKEPDCLTFSLAKSKTDPTEYVLIENYANQAAHEGHLKTEHFQAALPGLSECIAGPTNVIEVNHVC